VSDSPVPTTAIATWLTREEFLSIYALQQVAWWHPAYGANELPTEARDEFFSNLGRALRWALRYLIGLGAKFKGIEIDARGELRPTTKEPIEPKNELFLLKIGAGRMVSPLISIPAMLKMIEEQELALDRTPLVEVLIQCQKDSAAAIAWWDEDPDTAKLAEETMRERFTKANRILAEGEVN